MQLGLLAGALAAGTCGGYFVLRGWHEESVEARIDRYRESIWRHSASAGLPEELVRRVIRVESAGRARAVSRVGARGLMQLLPGAERDALDELRVDRGDLFDADYNIRIGTTYLSQLARRFDGDLWLALAAYHLGPTRVAGLRAEHAELSGREVVEQFAPPVTRDYCQAILGDKPARIVTGRNLPGSPSAR